MEQPTHNEVDPTFLAKALGESARMQASASVEKGKLKDLRSSLTAEENDALQAAKAELEKITTEIKE
jgi:hypothetical protein